MKGISVQKSDIWYLESTENFEKRRILIGKYRGSLVTCLIEVRKADGQTFCDTEYGKRAENALKNEEQRILYKKSDYLKSRKGKPYSWTYGENIEIKNNKGEIISIRQKRCDYFGQKETIKEIKL